jgi:hypothetical protein
MMRTLSLADAPIALAAYTTRKLTFILMEPSDNIYKTPAAYFLTEFIFEEYHLLEYNTVWPVECQPTFRRNILPSSSGSKNKPA